ncbi:hypothetical protein J0H58_23560 [bacterium]|nr:hypothetical protein [bacterium]
MSVLSITSVAIALARKAAGTPAATGDAELGGQLDDLVIHLSQLKAHCALLVDENRTLKRTAGGDADEPRVVIGN